VGGLAAFTVAASGVAAAGLLAACFAVFPETDGLVSEMFSAAFTAFMLEFPTVSRATG
jgi:hypothetical protein